jgi:hypothetical protein
MILDISGEPEVISGDYGGNYRVSLGPPDSLIADAGSSTDVYGKINLATSQSLFNRSETFFQNLSHTFDPHTEGGNLQVAAARFPGGIVGPIATIAITTQENIPNDFYGNGMSAVLWQSTDGYVAVWRMHGTTPTAENLIGINPGPSWRAIGTGDFNSDGYSDILFQNQSGEVAIWEMNGTTFIGGGSIATPARPGTSSQPLQPRRLLRHSFSEPERRGCHLGDERHHLYWRRSISNPGPTWHAIATGDFNHDGYSDILFQNDSGEVAIWEMNGTTFIGGGSIGNPGPTWHVIATGDFNHDGYSDILFQNQSGEVAIWEMNGTTFIGGGSIGNPGSSWRVITAGNFYGDGYSDILFQNTNGEAAIWKTNGTTVTSTGDLGNPGSSWHVIGQ